MRVLPRKAGSAESRLQAYTSRREYQKVTLEGWRITLRDGVDRRDDVPRDDEYRDGIDQDHAPREKARPCGRRRLYSDCSSLTEPTEGLLIKSRVQHIMTATLWMDGAVCT